MKKLIAAQILISILLLSSCRKEYSYENGGSTNSNIVGSDCRISKIVYTDSLSGFALGSIAAIINSNDQSTSITDFDSLSNSVNTVSSPLYIGDTVFINSDEYFVQNAASKRIVKFHGLQDPFNSGSPKIDVDYVYDASGYLIQKLYSYFLFSGAPYAQVDYVYAGGNLIHMDHVDLTTGDLIDDADITYNTLAPKNFIYLFPDELTNQVFTQFLNFGIKSKNALSAIIINNYTTGNVVVNTYTSNFTNYILSVDNYVLSCVMRGDDQPSIPAEAGKLTFSYHCK